MQNLINILHLNLNDDFLALSVQHVSPSMLGGARDAPKSASNSGEMNANVMCNGEYRFEFEHKINIWGLYACEWWLPPVEHNTNKCVNLFFRR